MKKIVFGFIIILVFGNEDGTLKNILITGGSGGIGRALVESFAASFGNVYFTYNKNETAAREISEKTGAIAIKCDASVAEEIKSAVSAAGQIDVLINNAGVSQIKLFGDLSDSEIKNMIDINLTAAMIFAREVLPGMISRKSGRIINIGSVWGRCGASCEVHYSAAKAGLRGFTFALAKETGPSGITVNCIEPGFIETEMNSALKPDEIASLIEATPLGRAGTPIDVASLAIFLAGDGASFITGQIIGVDGGFGL